MVFMLTRLGMGGVKSCLQQQKHHAAGTCLPACLPVSISGCLSEIIQLPGRWLRFLPGKAPCWEERGTEGRGPVRERGRREEGVLG